MTFTAIYFAHSLRDYGSERSKAVVAGLREQFPQAQVHDPEKFESTFRQRAAQHGWMEAYRSVLRERLGTATSAGLVIMEHWGHIGKGVFCEAQIAMQEMKIPVLVWRQGKLLPVSKIAIVDRDHWSIFYGRVVVASLERVS